ncbi:MAG: tetraacyldisaccharide 4'-kinase [Saprospirales bacterium]|nr:tetraacyldisaccharide 4'-kinase [Saprospirales bacterium]
MFQDPLIKLLLAPFSILYGMGVSLRNFFYRNRILLSVSFSIPVISVGSLTVGGAGKSPHIEYLIRLLRPYLNVSTLSRGYRRKTQGFRLVHPQNKVEECGDEPLMFKRKYPDVLVAVSESRSFGIPKILQHAPGTQVVLLDDAFQHLSVQPGLNIMLTEYSLPFTRDYLLPSGRLREWRNAYKRADVIVVSKCPPDIGQAEREALIAEIKPLPHQKVFFSSYRYQNPYYIFNSRYRVQLDEETEVLLVCAIANTEYLEDYLTEKTESVRVMAFEDHHFFEEKDLYEILRQWKAMTGRKRLLITTEKDAVRLEPHREWILKEQLPLVVLPIEVYFHFDEGPVFDELVKSFLLEFKV